jgi:hypothetical protein
MYPQNPNLKYHVDFSEMEKELIEVNRRKKILESSIYQIKEATDELNDKAKPDHRNIIEKLTDDLKEQESFLQKILCDKELVEKTICEMRSVIEAELNR